MLLHVTPLIFLKLFFQICYARLNKSDYFLFASYADRPAILATPEGFVYGNHAYLKEWNFLRVWFVIACVAFLFSVWKRFSFWRRVRKAGQRDASPERICLVERYRKELCIRQQVAVYITQAAVTPFTFGILHPVIVIPQKQTEDGLHYILYHELCHIKQRAGLVLLLRSVIMGLYWFYPLIYVLDACLDRAGELACDELAVRNMDFCGRKEYAQLLIEMAASGLETQKTVSSAFGNSKKDLKERIDCIMKKTTRNRRAALVLAFLMAVVSSFTAFAYETPRIFLMNEPTEEFLTDFINGDVAVTKKGRESDGFLIETKVIYDSQFADQEGNIFKEGPTVERVKCDHSYEEGTSQTHTKNSSGGCTIKIYSAKLCTKCNYTVRGKLISTTTYDPCPH